MQQEAVLKAVGQIAGQSYRLSSTQTTLIGRDTGCQIVLDSSNPQYRGISRRHAEIRPLAPAAPQSSVLWQICDLNSANGTYINGQRLRGCQTLRQGDRIQLDSQGPEFILEISSPQDKPLPPPRLPIAPPGDDLRLSQVIPVLSTGKDLIKKAYLVPGIATVILVVLLFGADTQLICQNGLINPFGLQTSCYNLILGTYLCLVTLYVTFQLCGKPKPWWVLLGASLFTIVIVNNKLIFSGLTFLFVYLPPGVRSITQEMLRGEQVGFIQGFFAMFFAAGLAEEWVKALPVFAALRLGRAVRTPWRERVGVWEPLDGILLGAASGVGFTYIETLGNYVNKPLNSIVEKAVESGLCQITNNALQCPDAVRELILSQGQFSGLLLTIPRILGAVAGHAAWSGYLGYFIGLSVLNPSRRWQMIGIGYVTSAAIHALWNSVSQLVPGNLMAQTILQTLIGILSYIFLVAAILKARQLSPTRAQNFATRMIKMPPP